MSGQSVKRLVESVDLLLLAVDLLLLAFQLILQSSLPNEIIFQNSLQVAAEVTLQAPCNAACTPTL